MFGEEHTCGTIILERMLKEKSMKKIMFAFAVIAILFASCANPIMPVDNTDDRLMGTWSWTDGEDTYIWHFNNDNTGYYNYGTGDINIEWDSEWNGNIGIFYYNDGTISENASYEIIDANHVKIGTVIFDKI